MKLVNFSVDENHGLCLGASQVDLHNDYNFTGFKYDPCNNSAESFAFLQTKMNTALMNSEVMFDIATASYPWWSGWPLLGLGLLCVVVFITLGWVECDSLPDDVIRSRQRLCIYWGLMLVGVMLCVVIFYFNKRADWHAFRELRLQRERGPLTVVEGEFVFDNSYFIPKESWQRAGPEDPPVFWIVVSKGERHEFDWDIASGYTARPVALSINKQDRLRVSFISDPTKKTQRALRIEKTAVKY